MTSSLTCPIRCMKSSKRFLTCWSRGRAVHADLVSLAKRYGTGAAFRWARPSGCCRSQQESRCQLSRALPRVLRRRLPLPKYGYPPEPVQGQGRTPGQRQRAPEVREASSSSSSSSRATATPSVATVQTRLTELGQGVQESRPGSPRRRTRAKQRPGFFAASCGASVAASRGNLVLLQC